MTLGAPDSYLRMKSISVILSITAIDRGGFVAKELLEIDCGDS